MREKEEAKAKAETKEEAKTKVQAKPKAQPKEVAKTPMAKPSSTACATIAMNGATLADGAQNGTNPKCGHKNSPLANQVEWRCASHVMEDFAKSRQAPHRS